MKHFIQKLIQDAYRHRIASKPATPVYDPTLNDSIAQASIYQAKAKSHGVNDCSECVYMTYEHTGGHCYMFRQPPTETCMKFELPLKTLRSKGLL